MKKDRVLTFGLDQSLLDAAWKKIKSAKISKSEFLRRTMQSIVVMTDSEIEMFWTVGKYRRKTIRRGLRGTGE